MKYYFSIHWFSLSLNDNHYKSKDSPEFRVNIATHFHFMEIAYQQQLPTSKLPAINLKNNLRKRIFMDYLE